jgi:hypothetical protein
MTQYGYSTPGNTITVSPTFSNIGSPDINVEGLATGDIRLTGGTSSATAAGGTTGGRRGGGRTTSGGGTSGGRTSGSKGYGLKAAVKAGQEKNPRVTKSELKAILEGKGPKGIAKVAGAIDSKGITLGGKAQSFLEKQLGKTSSGGSNKTSSGSILQKNLSTGGGIGRPNNQRPGGQSTQQKIRDIAGKKLTASEVNKATKELGAKKVLNQIQKGNIKAGKKAIAKAKAARRRGKK